MAVKEYFNEMVKNRLWDGRNIGIPSLFAFVKYGEEGLLSQELGIIINNKVAFIPN